MTESRNKEKPNADGSPPPWLVTWFGLWGVCFSIGFIALYAVLDRFGPATPHSGDIVARMVTSIFLGGYFGGTLLCLVALWKLGSEGPPVLRRIPAAWKIVSGAGVLPALVVAVTMVIATLPRERVGSAIFHPTAGIVGGGREEVELPLPEGWRAVYDLRQDWRSTRVFDAAGGLAFVVTVDLEESDVRSRESLMAHLAARYRPPGQTGETDCSTRSTRHGETWRCRTLVGAAPPQNEPRVRLEDYERWDGRLLAIRFTIAASRAQELERHAWTCVEGARRSTR